MNSGAFNNPCGAVVGKDEIFRLLSIVRKYPNCIVIADEIYDGLDFTGEQKSVASLSPDVPVFTTLLVGIRPTSDHSAQPSDCPERIHRLRDQPFEEGLMI